VFDNFEKVKGAQDRIDRALDRLKLDLAVAALTICSGSVAGVLLGEITLTQAAGRVVLDALCRENMQKTFRIAKLLSRNKVLEFAVGRAGEQIKAIATQESQKILQGVYMAASVGQSFIEKPHSKQYAMEKFLVKNSLGVWAACDALVEAPIASQEKERLFNALTQSHFCNPPLQKVLPQKLLPLDRTDLLFKAGDQLRLAGSVPGQHARFSHRVQQDTHPCGAGGQGVSHRLRGLQARVLYPVDHSGGIRRYRAAVH
jgi:hypothetical protein